MTRSAKRKKGKIPMKKFISILLAAVLSASLLAGCGGGSGNSEQKPATEAKEDAAQAQDASAQDTDANTNPAAGFYQIYVIDAATLDPIEGARVQFCSDSACMMGITDSSGLTTFESDPGTYTVHLLKAPKGYKNSTEEFTLTADSREATYQLEKEEAGAETAADTTDSQK